MPPENLLCVIVARIGDTLLTDTRAWLWRPPNWTSATRVTDTTGPKTSS